MQDSLPGRQCGTAKPQIQPSREKKGFYLLTPFSLLSLVSQSLTPWGLTVLDFSTVLSSPSGQMLRKPVPTLWHSTSPEPRSREKSQSLVVQTGQMWSSNMLQLSLCGTRQPNPSPAFTPEEVERAHNVRGQYESSSSQDSPLTKQPKPSGHVGSSESEKAYKQSLVQW